MFLEKVEIKGFKSFARPLIIDFSSPLTAIVGPNGSGKSNIVDAIRWVLGEQSAKSLRGSSMSDVIFSGSKGKKALNKASVTLHINNKDNILPLKMDKVKLGRTVYSNGESDYLLNDSVCRLKDIEELLMDTGLGKDSYSIVSQGQITSIINSKPEKLRELFEESAGISKHKARKVKTEKRLEKTNNDLQRIDDLITELKKQLPSLKKEAKKAKEYNQLYSELKLYEINLLNKQWQQFSNHLSELNKDHKILKEQIESQNTYVKNLEKETKEKSLEFDDKKEKQEKIKEEYYNIISKKEEAQNKLNIFKERKNNLIREKNEYKKQLKDMVKEEKILKKKKEQIKSEIDKSLQQIVEKKDILKEKENILKNKNEEIEEVKNNVVQIRNKIMNDQDLQSIKNDINRIEEKKKFLKEKINDLKILKKETTEKLNNLEEKKNHTEDKLENIEVKISELNTSKKQLRLKREELIEKLNNTQDKFAEIQQDYRDKKSRLSLLKEIKTDYRGYYRGVKYILKKKEEYPGIVGVVADLIKVDKKYEKAISTVLGSSLQNIVVSTDNTVKKCIKDLKKNKSGQATFLPINMIRGKVLDEKIINPEKMEGYLDIAYNLVSFRPDLDNVIKYLLGKIIVARDLKTALQIAKKTDSRYKIVSLEGDLIKPGGAVTGGSSEKNHQNLLGRERQIKELKQKSDKLKVKIKEYEDNISAIKEKIKNNKDKFNQTEKEFNSCQLLKNNIINDIKMYEKEIERLNSEIKKTDKQMNEINIDLQSSDKKYEDLKLQHKNAKDDYSRERKKIEELKKQINKKEEDREVIEKEKTDLKIEIASLNQKLENSRENLKETNENLHKINDKQKAHTQRTEDIDRELKQLKDKKISLEEQKEDFINKAQLLKNKSEELEDIIKEKKQIVEEMTQKLDISKEEANRYRDDLHKLELKINRINNKKERIKEKLYENYEFEPGKDEVQEVIEIEDQSEVETKINKLKNKIKNLGIINQAAIAEYQELNERVQYLKEQQEDLLSARKSLKKIIKKIEENMGELFYKSYIKVKEEFEVIFKDLFDGGQAELKLTEPDNYLETGVEVNAQPPGKKLKKLSLLSGGERALTAITLVFAFLNVNPSPLYILDEIDAPLDDANIVKYANFIEEYSEIAQFILITHRKHMMTRVDTLYGISMEESGVSKLVSLKMNKEGVKFA